MNFYRCTLYDESEIEYKEIMPKVQNMYSSIDLEHNSDIDNVSILFKQ